tara:strand:+ start:271 stop:1140 length:870 start_codon:yes stop_codon:yes gene_type:complete
MSIPLKDKNNLKAKINFADYSKNIKEINMSKTIATELENNKENDFLNSLKANVPLKSVLIKAKNVSKTLMVDIVPQMAKAVNSLMVEINSGNKTSLKDWNTIKFLRQHLYNLSSYDRSKDINSAFEMSITRAIKLAIMMYDNKDEFEVSNDNEVFIMSKVATPMIDVKLKGQKGGSKKQKNTSEELVEVNTGTIDKVYSAKYPTTSRSTQTKDTKINFGSMAVNFEKELEKIYNIATRKDQSKILDLLDERAIESIGNIKALLENNEIRIAYTNATENLSVSGEVKKAS